jgi:DNA-binding XRE family transcriptional regulator
MRSRLGWTQECLAVKAGLSVRVVAKAEAGGAVLPRTANALAQAFHDCGEAINFLPSEDDPLKIVQDVFRHYRLSNPSPDPTVIKLLSNDLVTTVVGDRDAIPFAGTYRGVVGFSHFWKRFFSVLSRRRGDLGENHQALVSGQQVVLWGYESLCVVDGPPTLPLLMLVTARVERRKLVRLDIHFDPMAVPTRVQRAQSIGLSELAAPSSRNGSPAIK